MDLSTPGLTIIDFTAAWCGPCRQLKPTLDALATAYKIPLVEVDVDAEQLTAQQFGVRSMPMIILPGRTSSAYSGPGWILTTGGSRERSSNSFEGALSSAAQRAPVQASSRARLRKFME